MPDKAATTTATAHSFSGNGRQPAAANTIHVVRLGFEVLRIDLPVQSVRHSRKIWNHVDELRVDSELVARLRRNGLRVGAVSAGAWPAIRAILDAAEARLRKEQMLPQGDASIIIELAEVADGEAIFRYDRDSRLVGKTFSGGTKRINLDYAFHPELSGCTDLRVTLEVRQDRGTMTWERRDGIIRQVPDVDCHLFDDLVAVLTLNPGEFLIIGPSEHADNDYLVGSRFLTYERAGESYETLLCITPQPYRTESLNRKRA